MTNNLKAVALAAIGAWACIALQSAEAQAPSYGKLYEQGVHAFFAGSACRADAYLSDALTFNSQDPRAYYFRALSLLRQGRIDEARGDMLVGATVEAQSPKRYAVGAALERVQGPDRLMLEEFRRNARRDVVTQASATTSAPAIRTAAPLERDAGVLRDKRIIPLEELLRSGGPQAIVDEPAAPPTPPQAKAPPQGPVPPQADSPFDEAPAATPAEQPAAEPGTPENPFSDDSEPPVTNPAPEAKTPPQDAPPATPPATLPAGPEEDPFGG